MITLLQKIFKNNYLLFIPATMTDYYSDVPEGLEYQIIQTIFYSDNYRPHPGKSVMLD